MQQIVTGGAGFIGSHLTDYLTKSGADTVIIDNLSTGRHLNKKAKFFKRDLRRTGSACLRISNWTACSRA